MQWANIAHAKQTRWYMNASGEIRNEPYANHLLRVCNHVREFQGSIEAQIAAVLHDIVEDTDVTLSEVRARYGDRVAEYVDALTLPEGSDKFPFDKCHIQCAVMKETKYDEVRLIKIADKFDNASTLPECQWVEKHKIAYFASAWMVVECAARYVHRSQRVTEFANLFRVMAKTLQDQHGWGDGLAHWQDHYHNHHATKANT